MYGEDSEFTKVLLEASNAKAKTRLPTNEELQRGWEGLTVGFPNHEYAPTTDAGSVDEEIHELVR